MNDLPQAKKVLSSTKNHEYNIKFSTLNQANIYLAVFHDASLGNLDGASQGASQFLIDNVGKVNPLIQASNRIKKVIKSTLAAETLSLVEAAENALLAKLIK